MITDDGIIHRGIAIDLKKNQWVETQSLTDKALDDVTGYTPNDSIWLGIIFWGSLLFITVLALGFHNGV